MFSSTVWRISGLACWKTRPMPARATLWAGQPAISVPSRRIEPALGFSSPITSFITVDLPEPFGPISPRISPGRRSRSTFLAATRPP